MELERSRDESNSVLPYDEDFEDNRVRHNREAPSRGRQLEDAPPNVAELVIPEEADEITPPEVIVPRQSVICMDESYVRREFEKGMLTRSRLRKYLKLNVNENFINYPTLFVFTDAVFKNKLLAGSATIQVIEDSNKFGFGLLQTA